MREYEEQKRRWQDQNRPATTSTQKPYLRATYSSTTPRSSSLVNSTSNYRLNGASYRKNSTYPPTSSSSINAYTESSTYPTTSVTSTTAISKKTLKTTTTTMTTTVSLSNHNNKRSCQPTLTTTVELQETTTGKQTRPKESNSSEDRSLVYSTKVNRSYSRHLTRHV